MPAPRKPEIDLMRSFALVGICIVNMPVLALYDAPDLMPPETRVDEIVYFVNCWLLEGKVFPLFAFMFGWGIAGQQAAARREGQVFAARYLRRLAGLLAIGIAHALFVYTGDILVLYALLGLAIWPFINWPPRALIMLALTFVPIAMTASVALGILISVDFGLIDNAPDIVTFLDAFAYRQLDWPASFGAVVLFNGPSAFAAFALGLAAARVDFFTPGNSAYLWLRQRWLKLALTGLAISLAYALAETAYTPESNDALILIGFSMGPLGALFLSTAYVIGIIELARATSFPQAFVGTGKNSLTTYVLQGLVGGAIVSGYGLSLGEGIGSAGYLAVALGVCLLTMAFARIWQIFFHRGPLEELLRAITGTR